jgi:hypothetical protein
MMRALMGDAHILAFSIEFAGETELVVSNVQHVHCSESLPPASYSNMSMIAHILAAP